ncbi:hypothetical protein JTE90_026743 [Oedothorax gibbosus]|uniref:MADF domain-containing protein n=1 Tax=Oedothorax gibbosus TaxID=931172 RepID=A0AAV6U6I1_9ARAC|nr:hypothetical protein JTE90_026743 [Oedothorax gibbosus]
MSSVEDDQKLIQVVEHHQVLWDNRIKGFRDKKQTTHAWASVAEILERDASDVMARWANLRKQYSRKVCQLRQRGGLESTDPEANWYLFPYFSFLMPCITPRKHLPNLPQFNHTPHQPSYTNNYPSTEDLSSSSMSDGGSEVNFHLVRVNPADKSDTVRKSLRSFTNKSKEQNKVSPITSTTKASNIPNNQHKEQSDNESICSTVLRVTRRPGPKSASSIPKPQSGDVKFVKCAIVKPSEVQAKKLKMSTDDRLDSSSLSKVTNGVSDNSRSEDCSSMACDSKEYESNNCDSKQCDSKSFDSKRCDLKSCDSKGWEFKSCDSKGCESKSFDSIGCESKSCDSKGRDSKSCDSKGRDSKSCDSKSYDADEYFLLSLAPDLRRLSPRQKYEVKSKLLDIVSEQYLMD